MVQRHDGYRRSPVREKMFQFGCIRLYSSLGGGFGPTYTSAHGEKVGSPCPPACMCDSGERSDAKSRDELLKAFWTILAAHSFFSYSAGVRAYGAETRNPYAKLPLYASGDSQCFHPDNLNIAPISSARFWDSISYINQRIITEPPVNFPSSNLSRVCCSGCIRRQAVIRSISAVRSRAFSASFSNFAARSFAAPAAIVAASSLAFERSLNSLWRLAPIMLKSTSPPTPAAISTSARVAPIFRRKNHMQGGLLRGQFPPPPQQQLSPPIPRPIVHMTMLKSLAGFQRHSLYRLVNAMRGMASFEAFGLVLG